MSGTNTNSWNFLPSLPVLIVYLSTMQSPTYLIPTDGSSTAVSRGPENTALPRGCVLDWRMRRRTDIGVLAVTAGSGSLEPLPLR